MLEIKNLVRYFGSVKAVDGLSLTVPRGSIFGFVGPNGAGKTTTMRILAGLLKAQSGEILIDGENCLQNKKGLAEKIGYMPDFFGVYDNLTVWEYMDFYAGTNYIPYEKREDIIKPLLEVVHLSHKGDEFVDGLSRGMKQRLCLARSLIHNPSILVLDEPASGLDPAARVELKGILRDLREQGKTILISSHILPELSEICTEIGIVKEGKLVMQGSTQELARKFMGKKQMRIRFLSHLEDAGAFLQSQEFVSDLVQYEREFGFAFAKDEAGIGDLVLNLVRNGYIPTNIYEKEDNLEDIFMQVTKGGVFDDESNRKTGDTNILS